MNKEDTHLVFDGKNIFISPDLVPIFEFLMDIEKEVESLLGFDKKLRSIRLQYAETIALVQHLAKKLKDNGIDFEFNLTEKPETIADKLKLYLPLRSQMIVLFSNLEVLFCLSIAYQNKTDNDKEIRDAAKDSKVVRKFINSYCLTEKNEWFKKNKGIISGISAKKLRGLRNSLTHFFSVSPSISIVPAVLDEKARKLEKIFKENGFQKPVFISPEDLYEMTKGAGRLAIEEWNDDSRRNQTEFKEGILAIKSVIEKNGAAIIKDSDLRL